MKKIILRHRNLLILVAVAAIALLYLLVLQRLSPTSLNHQKLVAEAFQPLAVGFGAVLTGFGALRYISDWVAKDDKRIDLNQNTKEYWVSKFPLKELGKKFDLVQSESQPGVLYISSDGKKFWIVNPETLVDLGFNYHDIKTIPDIALEGLGHGDNINTRRTIKDVELN